VKDLSDAGAWAWWGFWRTFTRRRKCLSRGRGTDYFASRQRGWGRGGCGIGVWVVGICEGNSGARCGAIHQSWIWRRKLLSNGPLVALIQAGLVESAHDCSDGGLAVMLVEAALPKCVGCGSQFGVPWASGGIRPFWGEDASRVVLSMRPGEAGANQRSSERIRVVRGCAGRDGWRSSRDQTRRRAGGFPLQSTNCDSVRGRVGEGSSN